MNSIMHGRVLKIKTYAGANGCSPETGQWEIGTMRKKANNFLNWTILYIESQRSLYIWQFVLETG